jgi:cation diffusion facilitator family transporter
MNDTLDKQRIVTQALVVNVLSVIPVGLTAVLANSMAMYADLLTYANMILANLVTWHTFRRMASGRTHGYDYGLGKIENGASLAASALILMAVVVTSYVSVHRLFVEPVQLTPWLMALCVLVQIASALLNAWLWVKGRRLAQAEYSPLLEAQWRANRADAIQSVSIIVTLGLSLVFHRFAWSVYLDPVGAILVSAGIVFSYRQVIHSSVCDLMDRSLEESVQMLIVKKLVEHFEHYDALHGVRSRRAGNRMFVELHLEFDPDARMGDVQARIDQIKQSMEREIPGSEISIVPTTHKL